MHRGFYMHNRARYFVQQGPLRPANAGPPERGYLVADGVNDYGRALNAAVGAVAAGVAGEVCLLVKTRNRTSVFVGVYGQLCDIAGATASTTEAATAALGYSGGATTSVVVRTWAPDSSGSASVTLGLASGTGLTLAMGKTSAPQIRGLAADGGVSLANSATAPTVARGADHVIIGARVNTALVPTNFAPLHWVSAVVLTRVPLAEEVRRYGGNPNDPDPEIAEDARDARRVWPDAIHAYWPAAGVVETTVPALVGAVPVTLFGGWSAADLVLS